MGSRRDHWTIQFLGGVGTVTGSKTLVGFGNKAILVDCGLFQGYKQLRLKNRKPLPVKPREIHAVLLTHAHIDHSGYVPLLVREGFRGRVFATPPTADLCRVLLPDAGYLQEEEARLANKYGFSKHKPALPLFTKADAERSLERFERIPFDKPFHMDGYTFEFLRAGHILGAAILRITGPSGRTLVFSGDLGRNNDPLMPPPVSITQADELVVESTYGHREHPTEDPKTLLADVVNRTIRRGGILVVPSFTVGRAQTLLFLLHELKAARLIPDVPVYVNSPMALRANRVFLAHAAELRVGERGGRQLVQVATPVATAAASKELDKDERPKIIIAGNGMATGGRVLHHLKTLLPNRKNTVLLVGYQAGGTRGWSLATGAKEIKIHGAMFPVRAEVARIEVLSAHADRSDLLGWMSHIRPPPKRTFVNHGEPEAADALRRSIEEALHWNVVVPETSERFSQLD